MPKITINPEELEDFKTNLYEYKGNVPVRRILAHTSADQVQFANKKNAETVVTELDTLIATAQSTATAAQNKAEAAQTAATSAQNTASAAQTAASNAASVANSANTKAEAAQTAASSATSIANTAKTSAEGATATANTANTTANAVKDAIENTTTGLAATKAIAEAAQTAANNAVSVANSANTKADNAYPKTGGELNGVITFPIGIHSITPPATSKHKSYVVFNGSDHVLGNIQYQATAGNYRNLFLTIADNYEHSGNRNFNSFYIGWDNAGNEYTRSGFTAGMLDKDYGNLVITGRLLKDYAAKNLTESVNMFVGGANASDTADLHAGRGFSSDKPFATLAGIEAYIARYINGYGPIYIVLQSNITTPAVNFRFGNIRTVYLTSAQDSVRTLTITGSLTCSSGCLRLQNLNITTSGNDVESIVTALGGWGVPPVVVLGQGLTFNGTVQNATAIANLGGTVISYYDIAGSIAGKRYNAYQGGKIYVNARGVEAIPGNIAGYCDNTSTYA